MKENYISCSAVARSAKTSNTHVLRSLRAFGLTPVKMPWTGRGGHDRLTFCITKDEAELYLKYRSGESPTSAPKRLDVCRAEETQKAKRESEGWTVIPTYKAGIPDLILVRKNKEGHLEMEFEEVKSPTDTIRKEQYLFSENMKELGIKVTFTWLD